MKMLVILFISVLGLHLSAQNASTVLVGKLTLGNDNTDAIAGTIRYNEDLGMFEGYNGQVWESLSPTCSCQCTYVANPSLYSNVFENYTLLNNKIQMAIEFNRPMDPSSFVYGQSIHVIGGTSSNAGTLTWSNNNTVLLIETNESLSDLSISCGWILQIEGNGQFPVRDVNGNLIDGDRDNFCGGDLIIQFEILC